MSKHRVKKSVILLSGGLDSSTLACFVAKGFKPYLKNKVYTLTFDYGQRHSKELESAKKISKKIDAAEHVVIKFDLTTWGGSSLTDHSIEIPTKRKLFSNKLHGSKMKRNKDLIVGSIPNTYVPARNAIFLSFGLSYAEAIDASEIYIGINSVDYSGYIDCRKSFIDKFQKMANVATVKGIRGNPINIKAPLINLSKAEIIKLGEKLGVCWEDTWSCYKGGKLACGVCDSCRLRLRGFVEAGVMDTLKYKSSPKFYRDSEVKRKSVYTNY